MHRITCILLAASKIWASGILAQNVAPSRVQWRTSLGTAYEDRPASIYEARDGGYVVAPSSWYPTTNAYGNMDAWLFWFDEKGLLISSNSFGGTSNDRFKTITQTADGGWIAAGITFSSASGNKTSAGYGGMDYWVVRLDSNRNKLWDKTFGGSDDDELCGVCETLDGGFLVAGHSFSGTDGNKTAPRIYPYGNSSRDAWLIRIDAEGEMLWQRTYGGSGSDQAFSVQRLSSGGFVLAGSFQSDFFPDPTRSGYGDEDAWILCLDSQGNELWDTVFGGTSIDQALHISQTADGGFIVGATTYSGVSGNKTTPTFGDADYWILRLDTNGNKVWEQTFGSTSYDVLCNVYETQEGNFIVGGYSGGDGGNKTAVRRQRVDAWFIRLDAKGNRVWEETYGGGYMTTARSMCLTRDGGFVFAGEEQKDTNPTSWDILVMKLAPDGLTAPLLSRARLDIATGGARFELSGIVGKTYAAESTADFIFWEPFITNTLLTPQVEIHHPLSFSQRFYRARLLP